MKKRRVLHQACAFSVAVMLVGVNAVPVVAADNNSVSTYADTDETKDRGDMYADVHVDTSKGYFSGWDSKTPVLTNDYLGYGSSIYLPQVVALDGWTWTGWEIEAPDGFVDHVTDTTQTGYQIVSTVKGAYKVEATFKQNTPAETQKTAHVTFNVDSEKGTITDPAGAKDVNYVLDENDGEAHPIPKVEAKKGYEFTGWKIEGANEGYWDANSTTFYVGGLAFYAPGSNDGYVTFTAQFKEKEAAVKVVNAKVTVAKEKGYFEEYGEDGIHETTNNNLQESNYTLGYLPKVVAKDGYTWTGWKVTNKAGEEVYSNLDTTTSSIAFDPAKADDYTVEATFTQNVKRTVDVAITVDGNKGSFPEYDGSELVSFANLEEDSEQAYELPKVEAKEGYKFIGWRVTNGVDEEVGAWDADSKTFGIQGLAHYAEGSNVAYLKIEAQFAEVETTKVVNATVVTDLKKGYFKGYEGTKELHNENLQDSNYNLEFLPEVVANDGYTFTGWVVTDSEGTEVYKLDPSAKTIAFPYGVADDYTVTATYEKTEEPAEEVVVNADIVINGDQGSFKGYEGATKLENKNLQESDYKLGFLPTVVANEGYTFKGWKVTNKAGEEVYNLDTATTSIMFPYGVADDYTVTAVLEKNPEEKAVANANVVINPEEGYFEGYEGATVLNNNNLQDDDYFLNFLPKVVANDGYTFKGWKVTNKAGEEIYNLDANTTSIAFPYGVEDNYTVVAVFEKDEEPEEVAVANARRILRRI